MPSPIVRHMPRGSEAARGAQRARALGDGETDDGIPFGWFVHEENSDETFEAAVLPYLDPPNRMWYYRTAADADFLVMDDVRTIKAVHAQLLTAADRRLLSVAFPMQGGVVLRHSDPDVDDALVRAMARAGVLHEDGLRGWTHSTMTRPDGGIHRRETVALHPSRLLRTASRGSPRGSSPRGSPRGSPRSPPRRTPRRSTPRRSPASNKSTPKTPRGRRRSSPKWSPLTTTWQPL